MTEEEEYKKDLDKIKKELLREGNTLLTKRDLLERFCEIDKEYNGEPWNLLQILANINILIGEEPNDNVVSREEVFEMVEQIQDAGGFVGYNTYSLAFDTVDNMKPAKCTRKKGKWINKSHTSDCGIRFVASECSCCGKKTFFDCDQLVYNYCPNCGARMSEDEL